MEAVCVSSRMFLSHRGDTNHVLKGFLFLDTYSRISRCAFYNVHYVPERSRCSPHPDRGVDKRLLSLSLRVPRNQSRRGGLGSGRKRERRGRQNWVRIRTDPLMASPGTSNRRPLKLGLLIGKRSLLYSS